MQRQLWFTVLAVVLGLGSSSAWALSYSDTQPLSSTGVAVFDPFDDLGGFRTLDSATIALDLSFPATFHMVGHPVDPMGQIDFEMYFSWAPDDSTYHTEPTGLGAQTLTFTAGPYAFMPQEPREISEIYIANMSYVDSTYDFSETYGVLVLTAILRQTSTGVSSGSMMLGPITGTATVTYTYFTPVPEPSAAWLLLLGVSAVALWRRSAP